MAGERALSVARDGLDDAVRKLNQFNWKWSRPLQDIPLAEDVSEYALAAALKAPWRSELLDADGKAWRGFQWIAPDAFEDIYDDRRLSGNPCHFTILQRGEDGMATLNRAPTSSFVSSYPTWRLRYYARIPLLTEPGSRLPSPDCELYAIAWAQKYVADIFDPFRAKGAKDRADEALREMLAMQERDELEGA